MEWIKIAIAGIGTVLTIALGGLDLPIQLLLIAMVIDFLTGIIRSGIMGKLSSNYGFKGILKKVGILLIISVAVIIDALTVKNGMLRTLVIYYFIANECLSVVENLGEAGVPIPTKLKNMILNLRKESEEDDSNESSTGQTPETQSGAQ